MKPLTGPNLPIPCCLLSFGLRLLAAGTSHVKIGQFLALFTLLHFTVTVAGAMPPETSSQGLVPGHNVAKLEIDAPQLVLRNVPVAITVKALRSDDSQATEFDGVGTLQGIATQTESGKIAELTSVRFSDGSATIQNVLFQETGSHAVLVSVDDHSTQFTVRAVPGILSLLPPLLAITLAFVAREVLLSLFAGIWLGALFIYDYNPFVGFMRTLDTYLINSLADPEHAAIVIFSMTLGGMVGVIAKSGGTQGIVEKLAKFASHRRGGQLATWAMGVVIFFDDYANSLIVGNTMRPFTDRLKISREKLSYIVDSTAAPVASIALVSTWIGYQVGLIDQAAESLNLPGNAYQMFLESIPHATYSILALVFVFLVGFTLRDFGPMRTAEVRSSSTGKVLRDGAQPIADSSSLDMAAEEGTPRLWYNALIPIVTVILVTFLGLYFNGRAALGEAAGNARLGAIFGEADSFSVLMWAAFGGLFVAAGLALFQKLLSLKDTMTAAVNGYKSMLMAFIILVLAWAIGDICEQLNTAGYVIVLTKGILSPHLIPFVTFVVAAFIAFSTGTSWATMAILTPIVVPMAFKLPMEAGLAASMNHEILIATIGAVLSGAVLGDHCSPISDTTILSSMASAADHVDHVRTQLPYALTVGVVASLVGYIPSGWGISTLVSLPVGVLLLVAIARFWGKKMETGPAGS